MKLKTRLAVAFLTITIVPILLFYVAVVGLSSYQTQSFRKEYGLTEQVDLFSGNSLQIFNRLTKRYQEEIRQTLKDDPGLYEDDTYLNNLNEELKSHYAYLIVLKGGEVSFCGSNDMQMDPALYDKLPDFDAMKGDLEGGIYLDGENQHLIKQMDFTFPDGTPGSVFIVSNVGDLVPEVKSMIREMLFLGIVILVVAGITLTVWVYRSILSPLNKLQEATKQIKAGNLDFTLDVDADDEIGELCNDFEEMRMRLRENAEEKVQYDKESKELISNISHDLKTPITAIKGYVEGIHDGVASSPEKLDKYIRTIYNKANDMDRLIDELTFYSKIDTNKIPYTFTKINVAQYFKDCIEEVGLDMEARGIELGYFNYVDEDVVVIADAEQMKRVINNIISNSIKYLDKKKGIINIRIKDVGDFIQVEIEDNGKGIAAKDLPNIFDRFYRTDSSRNSSQGGSGIGLSIVRKIIEDHGGRIWATSKEGIGTEIHFVLRKYQEVIAG
ncbi:sensor histidine kinase [Clostridium sp. AF18-27]|uniref:histidine kinase n=1 Tax=Enterocloster lavalensis TaxID=460384 RepID=A0A1I0H931_9FIRM|nr:HAMP domain-containing sensor histidine kinase [Enterocloster lavalensis]MBS5604742.1 HAMP domain-containing histidine kinase [Enterocloster asparagiformis]MCB6343341.1 HAMP domain-containing histidine kinase [Enterocloster lavalensis]RHR46494.1 sensor histidine kinase [Clostridium sp. AF18-27]SET80184.1 Signal transduction histidine kinase [Enterocloster lavalensis]